MSVAIEIAVEAPAWNDVADALKTVHRAIEEAVADAKLSDGELGVVLTNDEKMRSLNRAWRGTDEATNVLSFPAPEQSPSIGPHLLGDVVLAFETVVREAEAEGKPVSHHLSHLAVHGALHLLGYDHEREDEAELMENRERAILARLGIPDPYASAEEQRD